MVNPNEHATQPEHIVKAPPTPFDFADAFSDRDEPDDLIEFSPDVIREEMARHHPGIEHVWAEANGVEGHQPSNDFFKGQNTSVSTIDINGGGINSASVLVAHSPPLTPEDPELSSTFSRVSLSETYDGIDNHDDHTDDHQHVPYPNVVIDTSIVPFDVASHSPASIESPPLDTSLSEPHIPQTFNRSQSAPNTATFLPEHGASSLPPGPAASLSMPKPKSISFSHRPARSAGPSKFEQVVSKTRPSFLPPKPRKEDIRHMSDWQKMMKQSRAAGQLNKFVAYHIDACF
jgi:hypothetical protein